MQHFSQIRSAHDDQAFIALVKQRARTLRRESVPDFWQAVDATGRDVSRSLTRFLHSLARHRKWRDADNSVKGV